MSDVIYSKLEIYYFLILFTVLPFHTQRITQTPFVTFKEQMFLFLHFKK